MRTRGGESERLWWVVKGSVVFRRIGVGGEWGGGRIWLEDFGGGLGR